MISSGKRLGPYQIISPVGSGGMGEVYRALDTRLDRQVALKVLVNLSERPNLRLRFEREARVVSKLNHPHICALYDIGCQDGIDFLVLEYLEGETLASRLKKDKLAVNEIVNYAIDISDALSAAHAKGFLHRDMKPANIFITNSGVVKILDFGLATLAASPRPVLDNHSTVELKNDLLVSNSGGIVGTVAYMSPEQIAGETLDARTDLFSVGVVLYEMATRSLPFSGKAIGAVFNQILNFVPRSPLELNDELPSGLVQIIRKALERDRNSRYASATDLRADLQRLKHDLESGTTFSFFRQLGVVGAQTTIAVLPFVNLSADSENEYFSDGLAEDLTNALARIDGLRVASRTSMFAFKDKHQDVREIGRKLTVDFVLEGSVRRSGDKMRITVRLVSVTDGYEIWSESYDLRIEDEFDVQDQITEAIVTKLRLRLKGGNAAIVKRYTQSHEAYHLYLKGRYYWNKMTEEGYKKGFSYAEQAIAKDPDYALAYAGLADSYSVIGINGVAPATVVFSKAKLAATKALELDGSLAEAHMSLALARFWHDWDWTGAEAEFRQSLELNPGFVDAHGTYAWFLTLMGRYDEALSIIRRGQQLDPVSLTINVFAAWMLAYAGQIRAAMDEVSKVLEMDPNFSYAHLMLAETCVRQGQYQEGIEAYQRAIDVAGSNSIAESMLGYTYGIAGEKSKASRILTELTKRSQESFVASIHIALVYIGLGEKDRALVAIEKAYIERDGYMVFLNRHPFYDSLRSDARFQQILRRMDFPN